ncbi:MAG: methyltransferase domain-containing protein [Methanosarcinaceae archaeon]|nr:methyltransferase domain-containing protein [Methanosarcinaceae archaeon]
MNAACFHKGIHLSESDLCEENIHCPICQSTNRSIVTYLQKQPDIILKQCNNCFAVSASRIPTKSALNSYYNSYYQSNDEKITFDDPVRFVSHLYNQTHDHLTKKGTLTILDYGGGIGTISIEMAKIYQNSGIQEVRVTIVDYDQSKINCDYPGLTICKYSTLSEVKDQKFDIIIASAIVEHLPTPRIEINCLLELLNEYGLVYFRTPYIMPILLLLKKLRINFDFTYPAHIHDLGQEFWDSLLRILNLTDDFEILISKPSIVETSFSKHFGRTLIAYLLKAPWYVLGNRWNFVGGWEILIQKRISKTPVDNPEGIHDG